MNRAGSSHAAGTRRRRSLSRSGRSRSSPASGGTRLAFSSSAHAGWVKSPVPTTLMPLRSAPAARCGMSQSLLQARKNLSECGDRRGTCRFFGSSRRAVPGRRNRFRSCHAMCAHKPEHPLILAGGPGDAGRVSRDGAGPAAAVSAPGPRGKIVPSREDLQKAADADGRGRPRRQGRGQCAGGRGSWRPGVRHNGDKTWPGRISPPPPGPVHRASRRPVRLLHPRPACGSPAGGRTR
jgi:hypothetical protein